MSNYLSGLEKTWRLDRIFKTDANENSETYVSKMLANGESFEREPRITEGRTFSPRPLVFHDGSNPLSWS